MEPFNDDLQFIGGLVIVCSMAVRQANSDASDWPVLGEKGQEPISQGILHLVEQALQWLGTGWRFQIVVVIVQQILANEDREQTP